jgi:hypothetical protein
LKDADRWDSDQTRSTASHILVLVETTVTSEVRKGTTPVGIQMRMGALPHNCGGISQVYSFKERSWSDSIGYFRGDNNMEFISVMRVWLKRK